MREGETVEDIAHELNDKLRAARARIVHLERVLRLVEGLPRRCRVMGDQYDGLTKAALYDVADLITRALSDSNPFRESEHG